MPNREQKLIEYVQKLLFDTKIADTMPEDLLEIEGMKDIDITLRSLRTAIKSIGLGELSERIQGRGYTIGVVKNLQATLKNLTWHTKAISAGDFSERVVFLGEFSQAFNEMVKKLESARLEIQETSEKLQKSEEIHRLLADHASDVIWTMDLDGKFTYISPSVEKMRGYTVEEVMAQSKEELLCPSSYLYFDKGLEIQRELIRNNLPFQDFRGDVEQPCKDGSSVWTEMTVSGIYDKDNRFVGMLGVSRDITERLQMEEQIRRLSETDRLTQLNNRSKLDEVLKQEMERVDRGQSVCSVILMDLDNFKIINDTRGHLMGDEVLKGIARIIRENVRQIDTVGRWGGEEFMVIMPLTDINGGKHLAEKLRKKIEEHVFPDIGSVTASFGVAENRGDLSEIEWVAIADQALYKAKKGGRNRVCPRP